MPLFLVAALIGGLLALLISDQYLTLLIGSFRSIHQALALMVEMVVSGMVTFLKCTSYLILSQPDFKRVIVLIVLMELIVIGWL